MVLVASCAPSQQTSPAIAPAGTAIARTLPPAATSGVESAAANADARKVGAQLGDLFFDPQVLVVRVGATVTWRHGGSQQHDVTAADGSFRSITLSMGDLYSHTFTGPGRYAYFCSIHPTEMRAEVVVEPAN